MKSKSYRRRKFNKKRKSTYKIFFLVIIGMSLGFAAINTTLQLIGTLNISRTTWNIHWENPTKTGGVNATSDVHLKSGDNTTVEYQVKLTNPGDYYEFTVDAKNDGTIDGMITGISNKVYENNTEVALPAYLESTITYSDGKTIELNHLLASSKKETYKVKVAYKTGLAADQLPDSEKTYNFRFTVTYMQADEATSKNRLITIPVGRTKDNLQFGDEICISDQCFNFIRYDGNDIVMLAKYNLNVGDNAKGIATNKQDVDVKGKYNGMTTYGNIGFSYAAYWDDGSALKPKYGDEYPSNVYDTTYVTEPDFNNSGYNTEGYSIAYYVEIYKTILEEYGTTIKDARLLMLDEVTSNTNFECSNSYCTGFIADTSFYLGTAKNSNNVWSMASDGIFTGRSLQDGSYLFGVRPVIVIAKADI